MFVMHKMLRYFISMPMVEFIEYFSSNLYCQFSRRPYIVSADLGNDMLRRTKKLTKFRHGLGVYTQEGFRYNVG